MAIIYPPSGGKIYGDTKVYPPSGGKIYPGTAYPSGATPTHGPSILLETGDYLLLETGDHILLEV